MKLSPSSKDNFASGLFTLWLGPQQKLPVTLQESLMAISPSRDTFLSIIINKQALLSLQLSFSVSPGCFASILRCLLQICREEIGRPHLALRVNDKSNNSMNSFVISNTVLWQQVKNDWADSYWARCPLLRVWRKMGAGRGYARHTSEFHLRQNCFTEPSPHPGLCSGGAVPPHPEDTLPELKHMFATLIIDLPCEW